MLKLAFGLGGWLDIWWVGNGPGFGIGNGVGTFGQVGSFCCFWLGFGKWVGNFL
jgi:hypothetical protein